ncbi:cytochrome P450-like protein, partial [Dinothrombium tinctorium]
KKFNVWKAQNVRGPTPIPIFGNFADSLFKPMQFVDMERANKYGRIYGVYDGTVPSLVVSDPDLLKQVLVKNFNLFPNRRPFEVNDPIAERALDLLRDEEWKRIRSIVTPTFSSGKIRRMKPLIMQCVQNTLHYLDEVAARNEHLNLKSFWDQFTLSVIAKCCFALN